MSRTDDVLDSLAATLQAISVIEESFGGMSMPDRSATRMLAAQLIAQHMATAVAKEVGKHPQDVLAKIVEEAVKGLPQKQRRLWEEHTPLVERISKELATLMDGNANRWTIVQPFLLQMIAALSAALDSQPCRHNCDEGGICLAELSGYPESCPVKAGKSPWGEVR